MVTVEDVRIKHGNIWINANEMQKKAYKNYKQRYVERPLTTSFHIFSDGTYYESIAPSNAPSNAPSLPASLNIVKMVNITISRTDNNSYMPTYITETITTYAPTQPEPMQQSEPMQPEPAQPEPEPAQPEPAPAQPEPAQPEPAQPCKEYGIIDYNDIKLFLISAYSQANWVNARLYQAWAYIDFMYSNVDIKHYASRGSYVLEDGSDNEGYSSRRTYTLIDIDSHISPNIIFSIKRNINNSSVSFVRETGEQVRICDDERGRMAYQGYYNRMTMDVGMIVSSPSFHQAQLAHHIIPTTAIITETDIEDEQCILCYKYKKNITFMPCNHNIVCSCCYIKLDKGGRECPMCKSVIDTLQC
jgi:hypothetical protein